MKELNSVMQKKQKNNDETRSKSDQKCDKKIHDEIMIKEKVNESSLPNRAVKSEMKNTKEEITYKKEQGNHDGNFAPNFNYSNSNKSSIPKQVHTKARSDESVLSDSMNITFSPRIVSPGMKYTTEPINTYKNPPNNSSEFYNEQEAIVGNSMRCNKEDLPADLNNVSVYRNYEGRKWPTFMLSSRPGYTSTCKMCNEICHAGEVLVKEYSRTENVMYYRHYDCSNRAPEFKDWGYMRHQPNGGFYCALKNGSSRFQNEDPMYFKYIESGSHSDSASARSFNNHTENDSNKDDDVTADELAQEALKHLKKLINEGQETSTVEVFDSVTKGKNKSFSVLQAAMSIFSEMSKALKKEMEQKSNECELDTFFELIRNYYCYTNFD